MAQKYGCIIFECRGSRWVKEKDIINGKKLSWTIQHTTFTVDMLFLPLGCCDLVLGIE